MKTKEEIKEWLMRQDWYGLFKENLEEDIDSYLKYIVETIDRPKDVIPCAFTWAKTKEGWHFWRNVSENYIAWLYYGNEGRI